jgi:hypothetical protein
MYSVLQRVLGIQCQYTVVLGKGYLDLQFSMMYVFERQRNFILVPSFEEQVKWPTV